MISFMMGLAVAILSGLGIGGGGLLVIWLVLFGGTEQLTAQGINLIWFLFSSGAAMIVHLMKRRLNFKLISFLVIFGSIGAVLGSFLARRTSPELIKGLFGMLLICSGTFALLKRR